MAFASEILDEGEFAQLFCTVRKGDEPLTLSWALKGATISSEPGLTTASLGSRTSMLTINSVGYRHSGTYTCTAKNNAGVTSQTAKLKVNGKYLGWQTKEAQKALFKQKHSAVYFCSCARLISYIFFTIKIFSFIYPKNHLP